MEHTSDASSETLEIRIEVIERELTEEACPVCEERLLRLSYIRDVSGRGWQYGTVKMCEAHGAVVGTLGG